MNTLSRKRKVSRVVSLAIGSMAGFALALSGSAHAASVPANLGAGLYELAVVQQSLAPTAKLPTKRFHPTSDVSEQMTVTPDTMMRDDGGRLLVNVIVDGMFKYDQVRAGVIALPGLSITAEDRNYRSGIIEGFVPESTLVALAKTPGVSAVHAVHWPTTNIGSVTQQGVVQHRVDQLASNLDGSGITIGVLSDSYNTAQNFITGGVLTIREAQDIATCDLPGTGNPCGNTQPVVVLEDFGTYPNASATDEGRGMAQLIHDMAPKARLAFASAFNGDVSFANNIRALAGVQGLQNSRPGFAAQIIVDDVQYFNEGMFADTVIAQAVDDVTALGVSYFSSAGNTPPTQGYASDFRYVPVGAGAVAGTNVNLTGVPTSLYAGGFHNFRSDGGQDIAQTISLATGRQLRLTLQWDDPYDVTATSLGPVIFTGTGILTTPTSVVDRSLALVAGNQYQIDVRGDSTANGPGNLDVIVTIIQPDGTTLIVQDTGTSETFSFFAPQSGTYTIRVSGFAGDTGPFAITVNLGSGVSHMTTDFNMLFFRIDTGAYLGCVCENNLATNRPVELPGTLTFPTSVTQGQVQLVISRANIPTAPVPASRLRYKMLNAAFPAEYFSYSTPITYGHNSAAGANGVAAYSPFQPNIPEDFTSTGPVRIVWDRNNQRIPDALQIRLKPDIAAMDGGNTTFFVSDTSRDLDTFPNFFGTSAAAPNAASIAALVLQAKGGPGSVTPSQMKTMLARSAFPHDLDPYSASGQAIATPNHGKVTVTMVGDNSVTSQGDANGTTIAYVGPGSVVSITLDASTGNPGGGNVINPNTPGLVFDTRPNNNSLITGGQPFIVGAGSVGLSAADVSPVFTNPAPAPSVAGQYYTVTLTFTPGSFTGGKALRFGLDRDEQHSAFSPPTGDSRNGSSADLAGSVTRLPSGALAAGGITFTGTLSDGSTFSGVIANRIGSGWSFLDGFGFINAQSAVAQPLPTALTIDGAQVQ